MTCFAIKHEQKHPSPPTEAQCGRHSLSQHPSLEVQAQDIGSASPMPLPWTLPRKGEPQQGRSTPPQLWRWPHSVSGSNSIHGPSVDTGAAPAEVSEAGTGVTTMGLLWAEFLAMKPV